VAGGAQRAPRAEPAGRGERPPAGHALDRSRLVVLAHGFILGWLTGFEPAASRATTWRSNQAELQPPHAPTGAPEGTRTPDPQLRRLPLYPTELQAPGQLQAIQAAMTRTTGGHAVPPSRSPDLTPRTERYYRRFMGLVARPQEGGGLEVARRPRQRPEPTPAGRRCPTRSCSGSCPASGRPSRRKTQPRRGEGLAFRRGAPRDPIDLHPRLEPALRSVRGGAAEGPRRRCPPRTDSLARRAGHSPIRAVVDVQLLRARSASRRDRTPHGWSGRRDLNPRPRAPKARALPG
jgi:hypothetical protein